MLDSHTYQICYPLEIKLLLLLLKLCTYPKARILKFLLAREHRILGQACYLHSPVNYTDIAFDQPVLGDMQFVLSWQAIDYLILPWQSVLSTYLTRMGFAASSLLDFWD